MRIVLFSVLISILHGCSVFQEKNIPTADLVLISILQASNKLDNSEDERQGDILEKLTEFRKCQKTTSNSNDFDDIVKQLSDEAIKNQTGMDREQLRGVAKLLSSGQFVDDLQNLVAISLAVEPALKKSLWQSGSAVLSSIKKIKNQESDFSIKQCIDALMQKKTCVKKGLINSLVERVYDNPTIKLQRETLNEFLKNPTFRLALIVYARAHGIDIDSNDLDFVQNQLSKDDVEINALITKGKERLGQKLGIEDAKDKISELTQECS